MASSVADFVESRKTLAKLDETLEKLFKQLEKANIDYQEAHEMELIV